MDTFYYKILNTKLTSYLDGEMSVDEIYRWALNEAMSTKSESLFKKDPLIHQVIKDLIELGHNMQEHQPKRTALQYYQRCLRGDAVFYPPPPAKAGSPAAEGTGQQPPPAPSRLFVVCRRYVIVFALLSLFGHAAVALNPAWIFRDAPVDGSLRFKILWDSAPHIFYAAVILIPPRLLARGLYFYCALPVLVGGMVYYWSTSLDIIDQMNMSLPFVVILFPVGFLPATMALFLAISRWEFFKRRPYMGA